MRGLERTVFCDGYSLPRTQAIAERASRTLAVGETFHVEFAPRVLWTYRLRVRSAPTQTFYERLLVVRGR